MSLQKDVLCRKGPNGDANNRNRNRCCYDRYNGGISWLPTLREDSGTSTAEALHSFANLCQLVVDAYTRRGYGDIADIFTKAGWPEVQLMAKDLERSDKEAWQQ